MFSKSKNRDQSCLKLAITTTYIIRGGVELNLFTYIYCNTIQISSVYNIDALDFCMDVEMDVSIYYVRRP